MTGDTAGASNVDDLLRAARRLDTDDLLRLHRELCRLAAPIHAERSRERHAAGVAAARGWIRAAPERR